MPTTQQTQNMQRHFFDLATQYYIAGRFAIISGFVPVGGNLLHHAVEMYLKGALSHQLTLDQFRESRLRHNLNNVWSEFKAAFSDVRLLFYDDAIKELHRFERLRYPDTVLKEGMAVQVALRRGELVQAGAGTGPLPPQYQLVLEDIDELVQVVFEKAKATPSFSLGGLNDHARQFLALHNAHLCV